MDPRDLEIKDPCPADWSAMSVQDAGRARYCLQCEKKVHDLSAMTEQDARAFLRATERLEICVSYLKDAGGEMLFLPNPASATRPPTNVVPVSALTRTRPAVTLAKTAVAGALAACAPHGEQAPLEIDLKDPIAVENAIYDEPTIPEQQTPPPPLVEDTPCETPPDDTADTPRIRRTAGVPSRKPLERKKGKRIPNDDFLERTVGFVD